MKVLVTGGAGFIGSALVRQLLAEGDETAVVDKLTYAASPATLAPLKEEAGYSFLEADIADAPAMLKAFAEIDPDAVMHLAAETHVDRSIDGSAAFIATNVVGTHALLEASLRHWRNLAGPRRDAFRFVHISTDEVFGSLGAEGWFSEATAYDPSSPYSASKAASDHLVRAWGRTYGLPVLVSNCSNNYGPYQFPEKLIPLVILNALEGKPLPVYGDGRNVRDWLHVEDHTRALRLMLAKGRPGETYAVGGCSEQTNICVVEAICDCLDALKSGAKPRRSLITFVADRPGHDRRYAIDPSKIERELGWRPQHDFRSGLKATVEWYLSNRDWWGPLREKVYSGLRLGAAKP